FVAELVGTFTLVFVGAGAIILDTHTGGGVTLLGIAAAHGLALSIAVSITGPITGDHLNPAVTLAMLATKRIPGRKAGSYIVVQLLGATVAGVLLKGLYPAQAVAKSNLGTPALGPGVTFGQGVAIEAILTFLLVFPIFGVAVDPRAPQHITGFCIGLTVAFDILAGGPLSGAAMNPARTFGPALAAGFWADHLVYWIGPVLGGLLGAFLYQGLLLPRK
ncbi:MAG: MIP family channel protein, partial [candidate division NC10 bacterium]|nr:MIP family channel protein [candidate division NC10 bacterium]